MEIGKKIRELRMRKGLTQEELANRSELSKGFISQLENDVTSPSIATLVDVLTCLGTDLKTFFGEEQDNQIVFCEEDYFVKTDESQGNEIAWIVPNAQKNRMEPIRLTLQSGACTEVDSPHEGEEFGYVLSGRVLYPLSEVRKINDLRRFCCLRVSYSPNFVLFQHFSGRFYRSFMIPLRHKHIRFPAKISSVICSNRTESFLLF